MSSARPPVIFVNRVYRPSTAATAQLLTDLAEGLAAAGGDVQVIAAGTDPGLLNGVQVHRTGPGEVHGGMLSRLYNYRRFVRRAGAVLHRLVTPGSLVVLMTDPPMLGPALTGRILQRGGKVVHWLQDVYPEIAMAHAGKMLGLALLPLCLRRDVAWRTAARCVVLGQDMARVVEARGVPTGRILVQANWAPRELEAGPGTAGPSAQRRAWGVGEEFVIAYSGNLGRVHEFASVIDAASRLDHRSDLAFVFIGAGARLTAVRDAVRRRGLRRVHFRPPVPRDQLAASLAAADAHLVTLQPAFDGFVFPSKLAGALASGRPVLFAGSERNEIARMLEAEHCGAHVRPGDGAALAATIAAWAANREGTRELGRRARSLFERGYSFAAACRHWAGLLDELVPPA